VAAYLTLRRVRALERQLEEYDPREVKEVGARVMANVDPTLEEDIRTPEPPGIADMAASSRR